jgi:hypothetical protein
MFQPQKAIIKCFVYAKTVTLYKMHKMSVYYKASTFTWKQKNMNKHSPKEDSSNLLLHNWITLL